MEVLNVCRCCLSEGLHRDLHTPYIWMNNTEIYADMLVECFNISLSSSPYILSSICDPCIRCLRNAATFRHQVLKAEETILQHITNGVKLTDIGIKEEPIEIESDGNASDDYTLDAIKFESERTVKKEFDFPKKKITSNKKLRTTSKNIVKASGQTFKSIGLTLALPEIKIERVKPTKTETKRTDKTGGIPDIKIQRVKPTKTETKRRTVKMGEIPDIKIQRVKHTNTETKIRMDKTSEFNIKWMKTIYKDKDKNTQNLKSILKYSNATPFRKYPSRIARFGCLFCPDTCQSIEELRKHVIAKHDVERSDVGNIWDNKETTCKVDITDLHCTLCNEKFDSLANFTTHLIDVHKKKYYTDVKEIIVPYKLDKKQDMLECALCSSAHETFKMLSQHMNTHFSNYICDKCGATFITKRSKQTHDRRHESGEYKCELCDKVYINRQRLQYHKRMIHQHKGKVANCNKCSESFPNYYRRNQHMIKVHNIESPYKCNACNRQFLLKTLLMYHVKRNHLMEKNVACPTCGKRFFSKRTLKGHLLKHTGEKNYVCEICSKAYGRRCTLREHMRIHNNDRRFKCDICLMMFVQKCSLRSHLLTNHGINMAASDISVISAPS